MSKNLIFIAGFAVESFGQLYNRIRTSNMPAVGDIDWLMVDV